MTVTPESLRSDLASLATAGAKSHASIARIRDAATERRETVDDQARRLRGKAQTDAQASEEYQALMLERGRLDLVLGRNPGA